MLFKVSYVRKSDERELCSIAIDSRCSKQRVKCLIEALLLSVTAITRDNGNEGYWSIPSALQECIRSIYNWDSIHDTIFKYELRWYR